RFLVRAGDRPPSPARPATEHPAEQVVEVDVLPEPRGETGVRRGPAPGPASSARPAPPPARTSGGAVPGIRVNVVRNPAKIRPERVVAASCLRIGEDVVSLGNLLEPLLGPGVLVHVGVVGPSQLAVCPLDLLLGGGAAHPQDLVEDE